MGIVAILAATFWYDGKVTRFQVVWDQPGSDGVDFFEKPEWTAQRTGFKAFSGQVIDAFAKGRSDQDGLIGTGRDADSTRQRHPSGNSDSPDRGKRRGLFAGFPLKWGRGERTGVNSEANESGVSQSYNEDVGLSDVSDPGLRF